ncbi:MAG: DUF4416 family protein [Planctomycetes bacterium]|nr:DUF4416 family protein [Planctomycetota bacterium]
MAIPGSAESAVFFVGLLAAGRRELAEAAEALDHELGTPNRGSVVWPFDCTDYYRAELGPTPVRAFLSFPGKFRPDFLAARKLMTNRLEEKLSSRIGGSLPRPVNLDPGYLTSAKLVLASAKNFSHRIYLADGIYAEITLQYRKGGFKTLPWTFPDFASGRYDAFFMELRKTL